MLNENIKVEVLDICTIDYSYIAYGDWDDDMDALAREVVNHLRSGRDYYLGDDPKAHGWVFYACISDIDVMRVVNVYADGHFVGVFAFIDDEEEAA